MKKVVLATIVSFLAASVSMASNTISPYETAVGADTIVRQVIVKKKLASGESKYYKYLKIALEGGDPSKSHVEATAISCEPNGAKSVCMIEFAGEIETYGKMEPLSMEMTVNLYQGTVGPASVADLVK